MPRLFIAIELPRFVKDQLEMISSGVPGANWLPDDQLHLTLRFIGEVDGLLFRDITTALSEVLVEPFLLTPKGVGTFPPRGQPSVLWAGLEKSDELLRLRNKIENVLVQTGVEPEGRKFAPHITLARLKDSPMSHLGQFLTEYARFQTLPFQVTEFSLFSSVLTQKRAYHQIEETYSLLDDED